MKDNGDGQAPPMDVFPPLPTPGRKNKQKMDMKKKQEPDLVDIKAGQMTAELEMKLLDLSSGLLFLHDSQVLPAPSPGLLQSNSCSQSYSSHTFSHSPKMP